MRVLLARVSILSVCALAVSAVPARGQSPTLTSVSPGAGAPQNIPVVKTAPTKAAGEASSAASLEEMQATIKRLEMRVKELEDKADKKELENESDKGATDATPSVAPAKDVKEDAVEEETVKPAPTQQDRVGI